MASFGRRGTATEFMTKSFLAETPKMAQRERKGSGFVSCGADARSGAVEATSCAAATSCHVAVP